MGGSEQEEPTALARLDIGESKPPESKKNVEF